MSDFSERVPYELPHSKREAIAQLADILDIPMPELQGDGTSTLQAMCATIMFRHLDRFEEREALELINSQHPRVAMHLRTRALDPHVNPDWGVWSLTREEIDAAIASNERFLSIVGFWGLNPGQGGAAISVWRMLKTGITQGNAATLAASLLILGASELSEDHLERLRRERLNRLRPANENARY